MAREVNFSVYYFSDEDDWNLAYVEIKRLAASWRDIGIALGISGHVLDEIAGNHHHQAGDCLASVLQKWIGQNYNTDKFGLPSWRTLCRAIQSVSDNKFFKDLARKHGGKHYSRVHSKHHWFHDVLYSGKFS